MTPKHNPKSMGFPSWKLQNLVLFYIKNTLENIKNAVPLFSFDLKSKKVLLGNSIIFLLEYFSWFPLFVQPCVRSLKKLTPQIYLPSANFSTNYFTNLKLEYDKGFISKSLTKRKVKHSHSSSLTICDETYILSRGVTCAHFPLVVLHTRAFLWWWLRVWTFLGWWDMS